MEVAKNQDTTKSKQRSDHKKRSWRENSRNKQKCGWLEAQYPERRTKGRKEIKSTQNDVV